jgi:hypothetical protein
VFRGSGFYKTDNTSYLNLYGGLSGGVSAMISLCGGEYTGEPGWFTIFARESAQKTSKLIGKPNGTLTWDGTAIQYVSDQRLKQQISEIDDKLLDAWEDVTLCQFKYNDAVDQKGSDNARLHTGYVVQQIDTACKSHNLDISKYGLYCHEEYPERTEEVEVTQDDGTTSKETKVIEPAKEYYSLRYTETLVVECAYLRRENARLKERLQRHDEYFSNIEKRLQSLENS